MQIYFDVAVYVSKIEAELKYQQTETEASEEPLVAANDDGLCWPLMLFPEDWFASS